MNKGKLNSILKNDNRTFNVKRDNSENLVNKEFIKNLRKKLDYTQMVFSSVLGVSVKTIEKWEQGAVEPRNIVKKFLFLIDKKPELVSEFYSYKSHIVKPKYDEYIISAGVNIFVDVPRVTHTATMYNIRDFKPHYMPNIQEVEVDQGNKYCPA